AVRDADVLGPRLASRRGQLARVDVASFDVIAARLRSERAGAVLALDAALRSDRYLALLDRLERAVAAPPFAPAGEDAPLRPERPAIEALPGLVHRPWHALNKAVRELGDGPDEALHRIRIAAKRLRY